MKKTSAALLTVPLVASMLLAGCGGSTKPDASRSSTTAPSPASTAAPTASTTTTSAASPTIDPNIPAAARAHTPAGAEAFVRYYLERLNVAWTEPRAGILAPMCQSASKSCSANEETAARLARTGHRYDGNPVTVKSVGALDRTGANQLGILARVVQERRSEVDRSGKTYVTDQRKDLRLHFQVLYIGQAWSILTIKLIK